MILRWVTAAYLAYLFAPIALLVTGSFGDTWLNSLLPAGLTGRWYAEVARDASFRRAFGVSLAVAAATCAACVALGLPLAYAIFQRQWSNRRSGRLSGSRRPAHGHGCQTCRNPGVQDLAAGPGCAYN